MTGRELAESVLGNINKVIVGKEETARLLLTAILADGHVLLEHVPGTGKTKLAKTLAKSLTADFSRCPSAVNVPISSCKRIVTFFCALVIAV